MVKNLAATAEDSEDRSSIPGVRRSPGEGNGNPLQYSCLGNPMERGALVAFQDTYKILKDKVKSQFLIARFLFIFISRKKIKFFHLREKFNVCFSV